MATDVGGVDGGEETVGDELGKMEGMDIPEVWVRGVWRGRRSMGGLVEEEVMDGGDEAFVFW